MPALQLLCSPLCALKWLFSSRQPNLSGITHLHKFTSTSALYNRKRNSAGRDVKKKRKKTKTNQEVVLQVIKGTPKGAHVEAACLQHTDPFTAWGRWPYFTWQWNGDWPRNLIPRWWIKGTKTRGLAFSSGNISGHGWMGVYWFWLMATFLLINAMWSLFGSTKAKWSFQFISVMCFMWTERTAYEVHLQWFTHRSVCLSTSLFTTEK